RRRGQRQRKDRPQGPVGDCRRALRTRWKEAQMAAESMVQAAADSDAMQLTIKADELDAVLARLWEMREVRDINWQTILNHVQGMLKLAFAEKRVERLTAEQCDKIRTIVERHLGTSTKSIDDLKDAVGLIEEAGFDPYGAISADPVNEEAPDA